MPATYFAVWRTAVWRTKDVHPQLGEQLRWHIKTGVPNSGEGRWTIKAAIKAAIEEAVPVPVLAVALFDRFTLVALKLVISIQPRERISLEMGAKIPGPVLRIGKVAV